MGDAQQGRRPQGTGHLVIKPHPKVNEVERDGGNVRSTVSEIQYTYPLKLMVPDHASSSTCQWVYPITFGGGLVEADHITYRIVVEVACTILLTTQSSTKVYHCPLNQDTIQKLSYKAAPNSLLAILPDPIVPFENACYRQTQHIEISSQASLLLLDWLTSGRLARGEHYLFKRLTCSNHIDIDGVPVFRDTVKLEDKPSLSMADAMGTYSVIGSLIILGDSMRNVTRSVLESHGKHKSFDSIYSCESLLGASPLEYCIPGHTVTGCILRFSANSIENIYMVLEEILGPIMPVLGGNPFANKY